MAYIRPMRNRLRSLPVRQYQGPLPTRLLGLGQLNCPGDPGCPGNPIDIGTSAVVNVTPTGSTITTPQGVQVFAAPGGSLTDWLNQNSSTVLWIGGIALAVLLLSRVAR